MPILLKQYLRLGGRLLGFNVDPEFSNVLDVLIMVDLRRTAPKIPMTIGAAVGTITVDWDGDGVLQRSADLPADRWTDVGGGWTAGCWVWIRA